MNLVADRTKTTGAVALIRELEREIITAANLKAQLAEVVKGCQTGFTKATVNLQICLIANRILRAQREIFAIERACFAELQSARRDEIYPPIPVVEKSKI